MWNLTRRRAMGVWAGYGAALLLAGSNDALSSTPLPGITAYRNPGCGCCENWAEKMKAAGFLDITMIEDADLAARRAALGIPEAFAGCHLAMVGEYVIEGHVPPGDILSLLRTKPEAKGLSVPGMPVGSPGMEMGDALEPYDVLIFTADGTSKVYASYGT